ncbi:MAG TPA: NUDIX domain-containing protein [Blastocatellia bacterium]
MKFGSYNPEAEYRQRPGAYAIILNGQGQFASVRWRDTYLLPGGGVEQGESLEDTLTREVREECAREVAIGEFLGSAIQYFTNENGRHWEFQCSYFEAQFGTALDNEPEHELVWLNVADAHHLLAHEVHGWAVNLAAEQYRDR